MNYDLKPDKRIYIPLKLNRILKCRQVLESVFCIYIPLKLNRIMVSPPVRGRTLTIYIPLKLNRIIMDIASSIARI